MTTVAIHGPRGASNHSQPEASIESIPDETMSRIFSNLSAQELGADRRVCRRWHQIIGTYLKIDNGGFRVSMFTEEPRAVDSANGRRTLAEAMGSLKLAHAVSSERLGLPNPFTNDPFTYIRIGFGSDRSVEDPRPRPGRPVGGFQPAGLYTNSNFDDQPGVAVVRKF